MLNPFFEPGHAELWRNPFSRYKALRDEDSVHHVENGQAGEDYWVLFRFRNGFDAAIDAQTFSSADGLTFPYGERDQFGENAPPPAGVEYPHRGLVVRTPSIGGAENGAYFAYPRRVLTVPSRIRLSMAQRDWSAQ